MTYASVDGLHVSLAGNGVLTLTLDRLAKRNALDDTMVEGLIGAVEQAFRLHAEGRTLWPGVLGVPAPGGGFHIKAAGLVGERSYFAAKTNANFPENPRRFGLPTIQGTIGSRRERSA